MKIVRIIIIDNNQFERDLTINRIKSLNHYDYRIFEATTLLSALSVLKKNSFDIIFFNTKVPDWLGIQTLQILENEFPYTSKIAIIDNVNDQIIKVLLQNGLNNYLIGNKFTSEQLNKVIHNAIKWNENIKEQNGKMNFFHAAIDSLEASISVLDEDGKIIYVNKAWREFADSNNNKMKEYGIGLNYIEIANGDEETGKKTANAIKEILNNERDSFYIQYPCHSPEERRWFSLKLSHFSENGNKRIVTTHENITYRKDSEKVKETTNKIFKHSIDMLCIAGLDGYFKVINPAWSKTLGWSSEVLISKPWIEFVHSDDRDLVRNIKTTLINGVECLQFVVRYLCKNGKYKWISWNAFPDKKDNILFGVARDITDQKRLEFELLESKKAAEKSDKLKSEFLTQMSHEIRTPLNSLLGFASLLVSDLTDANTSELKDAFYNMELSGKRIFKTIELLIKVSELHTDNFEPEFKKNNLFELLNELVKEYKPFADQKGVELEILNLAESTDIIFDKRSIYDVFTNIIDNAIKYTAKGSVKILIENSLNNKLSVNVVDTGIGISEKFIENMFDHFTQESTGYTRKFDGNGLGLSLVKKYCDLNKAKISVESKKGFGSNFNVTFN